MCLPFTSPHVAEDPAGHRRAQAAVFLGTRARACCREPLEVSGGVASHKQSRAASLSSAARKRCLLRCTLLSLGYARSLLLLLLASVNMHARSKVPREETRQ
ncbi:hypothetical protein GUJ93_ZPchr0006g46081 [Zizania palustris]|uniref:Uncharacterized protein n=1 Tax=Zizania palustris TaxID=103762 RepID=A0A8J5SNS0_ZIZPA|nr:hypothetical protein GUJ93_ZPchr0006g46081 [Zizania palustris]